MKRKLSIRLCYRETGQIFKWTIYWVKRIVLINPDGPLSKRRFASGWFYRDHDGYERFVEGNWQDLLPRVRLTADNYGCDILTELN